MTKTYFWLKLKDDFFKSREIKKLRKVAGGDTYTIIYLKLQLLSIKNDCLIEFEKTEQDIFEQLSIELDESLENIKMTISFLQSNNLIDFNSNQDIFMSSTLKNIGSETVGAERVRQHRLRKNQEKMLQCNDIVTICNTEIEIELDKEKDIELDKEKDIELDKEKEINKDNDGKPSTTNKNKLSKEQVEAFITRWNNFAERVDIPPIKVFNKEREKKLNARIKEAGGLDCFMDIISRNWKNSSFLSGETQAKFKFTIDFVLQASSFLKMMEGNYIDKDKGNNW